MRVTRRDYLKTLLVAFVIGIKTSYAGDKGRLSISSLNITLPVWLFDEKSKEKGRVQVLAIEENKETKKIVVLFEGNRRLTLNPDTSVQWLMQRNGNRSTRESMLLKRIISLCLDAFFSSVADKRHHERGISLKEEFDALQAQEVIEVITIGAMKHLLWKLNNLPVISSVSWDNGNRWFIVR